METQEIIDIFKQHRSQGSRAQIMPYPYIAVAKMIESKRFKIIGWHDPKGLEGKTLQEFMETKYPPGEYTVLLRVNKKQEIKRRVSIKKGSGAVPTNAPSMAK